MTYTVLTVAVCAFCCVLPSAQYRKYDLIVIPIPKISRSNNIIEESRVNNKKNNDNHRLDIEDYEEPTETFDIDNFNYGNTRDDELKKDSDYDSEVNYGDDKIVGGVEVDISLYPYHAAYGTNCGGAIIDKKWVITAGHCGKKPYVKVGSKYLNKGKKVSIKKSHVHPMWSSKNKEHPFDYDFQLLELAEALQFNDNIQPVKIAHIEDMVIGKVITVTGWGNTEENGPYSYVLRAVRVPITSKETCQSVPFPYFRGGLTARMFCAGFSEGKKDACQGDSGGPAVANDRLLGMVSFGYGCATPGSYGVYSKVAKVRKWIQETTGGYEVGIREAPYHVSYGDICGAVLIKKKWALTTAHCGSEETYVRVGSKYRLRGRKAQIKRHIVHPEYGRRHIFDYDVQLLGLYRELHFNDAVSSLVISEGECGDYVYVTGWGYSREKGEYNDRLQQIRLQIVLLNHCQNFKEFWYNHTLTNRMFCAWEDGKDACQGDSGTAAVSFGKLVGLSSFGFGCGRRIPGVYTNTSNTHIRKWIKYYTGL